MSITGRSERYPDEQPPMLLGSRDPHPAPGSWPVGRGVSHAAGPSPHLLDWWVGTGECGEASAVQLVLRPPDDPPRSSLTGSYHPAWWAAGPCAWMPELRAPPSSFRSRPPAGAQTACAHGIRPFPAGRCRPAHSELSSAWGRGEQRRRPWCSSSSNPGSSRTGQGLCGPASLPGGAIVRRVQRQRVLKSR